MGENSGIEWTDHTFSPWWGCVEDGPECDHCYARAWAKRTGHAVWGHDQPRRFFGDVRWKEPLLWNRRAERADAQARVFCGSMCDIGERRNDDVGARMDAERERLWALIKRTPRLTWLLLTKRPQNLPTLLPLEWLGGRIPTNVEIGTTAGDQGGWDKRVRYLARMDAVARFVSCEPLLGPIIIPRDQLRPGRGIDWVIVGSESGPRARPSNLDWVRSLRDQCVNAGVAFFFKQWTVGREVISLPELDGRVWAQIPGEMTSHG